MPFDPNELSAKERIVVASFAIDSTRRYPPEYLSMMVVRLTQEVEDDDPRFDTVYDASTHIVHLMDKVMMSVHADQIRNEQP